PSPRWSTGCWSSSGGCRAGRRRWRCACSRRARRQTASPTTRRSSGRACATCSPATPRTSRRRCGDRDGPADGDRRRRRQTWAEPPREESTVRILVTNDDGVGSAGLHALARAVVEAGHEVRVVAPSEDMSGSSAAIGQVHLDRSIDARPVELPGLDGVPAYALDGPPGLCVLADRIGGFGEPSEMVLSGVNPGANTGRAVLHSGTVGGALTGANFGVSGLAVSIAVPSGLAHEATTVPARDDGAVAEVVGSPVGAREGAGRDRGLPEHWDTAARIAASLVGWLADAPRCTVLNVNV